MRRWRRSPRGICRRDRDGSTSRNGMVFAVLRFGTGKRVDLESKSGKPLTRYFPELVSSLVALRASRFVLDGEIVIPRDGNLSFDDLLMRIHPAASRVEKLSKETPCLFIVFDLLVDAAGKQLTQLSFARAARSFGNFSRGKFCAAARRFVFRRLLTTFPWRESGFK